MDNKQWREFMDAAMGVPPGQVTVAAVRRRLVRRRVKEAAGVLAAIAVAVTSVTAAVRVYGTPPGPAAHHRPTVYVSYTTGPGGPLPCRGAVFPISTATNTVGKPVRVGEGDQIAITPDGRTAYVLNDCAGTVTPVSTATNTAGKPIYVGRTHLGGGPTFIAITPNGKTAYVASTGRSTVVPISTATNTAGKPIPVTPRPVGIAITPDGKTAYVVSEPTHGQTGTVTPVSTATNTAGKPIPIHGISFEIAITPDGKTVYAYSGSTVTPISTATNTPGTPIQLHSNFGEGAIAITPDGKTVYVLTFNPEAVVPISTATNTPGTPIKVHLAPWGLPLFGMLASTQFVITPNGKTAYLSTGADSVIPISTATNTAGRTIQFGSDCRRQFEFRSTNGIAITPDSRTAYVACESAVVPISTATNTPGKPIPVPLRETDNIAITP